jgi:hypothetical protein
MLERQVFYIIPLNQPYLSILNQVNYIKINIILRKLILNFLFVHLYK